MFYDEYIESLYFEKVAKKEQKKSRVKGLYGPEHPSVHDHYDKKRSKMLPGLYSAVGGVGGGYAGYRLADYAVESFKKNPSSKIGNAFRNSKGLSGGYKGLVAAGMGASLANSGYHVGKAIGQYSDKHKMNLS